MSSLVSASEARPVSAPPLTAMPAPILLKAVGIGKTFGAHRVLDKVSLEMRKGEVVAIIGPSGSGKSTFLRCINQLETPTEGVVSIGDVTLSAGASPSRRDLLALRRKIGMVFQSFNLFPHLSVLRNVSLAQERTMGRTQKEADERSMELLARVGLAQKANQYPARCSGGQQQRIAIARALALDPEVMLFDEPTSALDPELGLEVLAVMQELAASGMTMIVVTHEMHFAERVSDRVVLMADGRILEEGPSAEVMRFPKTERAIKFFHAVRDRS
ncbi:ABC transporter [Burkholderia sp. YI23]|nr:ABC transporter [Burkholderia sp. YI23]